MHFRNFVESSTHLQSRLQAAVADEQLVSPHATQVPTDAVPASSSAASGRLAVARLESGTHATAESSTGAVSATSGFAASTTDVSGAPLSGLPPPSFVLPPHAMITAAEPNATPRSKCTLRMTSLPSRSPPTNQQPNAPCHRRDASYTKEQAATRQFG